MNLSGDDFIQLRSIHQTVFLGRVSIKRQQQNEKNGAECRVNSVNAHQAFGRKIRQIDGDQPANNRSKLKTNARVDPTAHTKTRHKIYLQRGKSNNNEPKLLRNSAPIRGVDSNKRQHRRKTHSLQQTQQHQTGKT